MTQSLHDICATLLSATTKLLDEGAVEWSDVKPGVCRVLDDLAQRADLTAPPLRMRIESWIFAQDALRGRDMSCRARCPIDRIGCPYDRRGDA
jgi:hypothetical protein